MSNEPVLEVRDLVTYFFLRRGVVKAVDGVSFDLKRGEVLGLVGEFGLRQEPDRAVHHAFVAERERPYAARRGSPRRRKYPDPLPA